MDDFIYFLLVIGWLGYSIYKQSEKKKRLQAARNAEQQGKSMPDYAAPAIPQPEELPQKPIQPDLSKSLQEILFGDLQTLEKIPENEAQSLEQIPEPAFSEESRYQDNSNIERYQQYDWKQRFNDTYAKTSEKESNKLEQEIIFLEEETNSNWSGFDLRKAIIYSEILNRRYVH